MRTARWLTGLNGARPTLLAETCEPKTVDRGAFATPLAQEAPRSPHACRQPEPVSDIPPPISDLEHGHPEPYHSCNTGDTKPHKFQRDGTSVIRLPGVDQLDQNQACASGVIRSGSVMRLKVLERARRTSRGDQRPSDLAIELKPDAVWRSGCQTHGLMGSAARWGWIYGCRITPHCRVAQTA